jgi:hypothetical protein
VIADTSRTLRIVSRKTRPFETEQITRSITLATLEPEKVRLHSARSRIVAGYLSVFFVRNRVEIRPGITTP